MSDTAEEFGIDREDGSLMLALSTASSTAPATKPRPWFDVLSTVARKKLNAPPEWQWFSARVLSPTDDTLIEGAVPNRRKNGTRLATSSALVALTRCSFRMPPVPPRFQRE